MKKENFNLSYYGNISETKFGKQQFGNNDNFYSSTRSTPQQSCLALRLILS